MSMNRWAFSVTAILVLALSGQAGAHPYGPEYYSFRTIVEAEGSTLRVTVAVEAPTPKVLQEFAARYADAEEIGEKQDREFFELQLARIAEGLSVTVDGQPLAARWSPADSPINGRADERFFYYFVTLEQADALPSKVCRLEVLNRAFPEDQAYYSGWVKPHAAWSVAETNLAVLGAAAQAEDVSTVEEAWSNDAALRDLRVTLTPVGGTP
jgi:hypothetical protein